MAIERGTERCIVFLDSGVGGLPYLDLARRALPGWRMHYLADDAGFPYGTKSASKVSDLVLDRVRRLRARFDPVALVIACNTASQAALAAIREQNPGVEVIGTVPAVKPAAASTLTGTIGVLATARTVEDPYLDDLVARHAHGVNVVRRAAQDLVEFVERRFLDSGAGERRAAVEAHLDALLDSGADRIVLACTHFLHLEADFTECLAARGKSGVEVVDSRKGVIARLVQMLAEQGGEGGEDEKGVFLLTSEGPFAPAYALWASRYGLTGPERL